MKKILLMLVTSFTLINLTPSLYANIIENQSNMKKVNWIFLWNKKFDKTKFREDNSEYHTNNMNNDFNNDKKSFLDSYYSKENKSRLNPYLYYEFELDNNKTIESVKDYLWNDLEFYNIVDKDWSYLRIYLSSFYNTIKKEYYKYDEYKYDEYQYLKKDEKIIVEFDDSTNFTFRFKSNIPDIKIINENEWKNIIIKEDKKIILDLNWANQNDIFINEINYERDFETAYSSWKLTSTYNWDFRARYNEYLIWFFWEYDLYAETYDVINNTFCESDKEFYIYHNDSNNTFNIGTDSYDSLIIDNFDIQIQKYNDENWVVDFDNYEINIKNDWSDWDDITFKLNIEEDWLYKIIVDSESREEYLCKKYYNSNIKTNQIEHPYLMNNNIFYKDWKDFWVYVLYESLFDDFENNFFNIKWEYQDFLDKIEKFDFKIKTELWGLLYEGDKSCINNYDCERDAGNEVYEYLEQNPIFWNISIEVDYKNKFSWERNIFIKNIINENKTLFEDIIDTKNGLFYINENLAFLNQEFGSNIDEYNIKYKDINGDYIVLPKLETTEVEEIISIVEEKIEQEYWNVYEFQHIYLDYLEDEIINRYWSESMIIDWALYISDSKKISKIEIYKQWLLKKEYDLDNILKFKWNKLIFNRISEHYYHFNTNSLWFGLMQNFRSINYSSGNETIEAKQLIENEDYEYDYWDWAEHKINDENLLQKNNGNKILYINPEEWKNIIILIPKSIIENINNLKLIWDSQEDFNDIIIKSDLIKINQLKESQLKLKSWKSFSIMHKFKEKFNKWILFKREVNILFKKNNIELLRSFWSETNDYKVDVNISWENIKYIDREKLYICKEEISDLSMLNNKEICKNKKYIDFFSYYIKWDYNSEFDNTNFIDFYIYGLDWIVNDDYKNINVEFEIRKYEKIIYS